MARYPSASPKNPAHFSYTLTINKYIPCKLRERKLADGNRLVGDNVLVLQGKGGGHGEEAAGGGGGGRGASAEGGEVRQATKRSI